MPTAWAAAAAGARSRARALPSGERLLALVMCLVNWPSRTWGMCHARIRTLLLRKVFWSRMAAIGAPSSSVPATSSEWSPALASHASYT